MITIMLWIWVVLFVAGITATCWVGWNVYDTGRQTENYDFYGWVSLFIAAVVFDALSWFTIKALQSVC